MAPGAAREPDYYLEWRLRIAVWTSVAVAALLIALATPWYQIGDDDPRTIWDQDSAHGQSYGLVGWVIVAAVLTALVAGTAPSRESALAACLASGLAAVLEILTITGLVTSRDDGVTSDPDKVHLHPGLILAVLGTLLALATFLPILLRRRDAPSSQPPGKQRANDDQS